MGYLQDCILHLATILTAHHGTQEGAAQEHQDAHAASGWHDCSEEDGAYRWVLSGLVHMSLVTLTCHFGSQYLLVRFDPLHTFCVIEPSQMGHRVELELMLPGLST